MDQEFSDDELSEKEQTILGLFYSVELNTQDSETNEYLLGEKRVKLDVEGIFSISKQRIGEEVNLLSTILKLLLDKDMILVDNGIYSLTDPENPEQLSHFNGSVMNTFYIENDCAFVDSFGLQILNISDPLNPFEIFHYYDSGNTSAVYVEDDIAYLGTYIYGDFMGFTVVDVSNKTNPQKLWHYNTTSIVAGIRVLGDLALVASWEDGLLIFNVSNPASPIFLSNFFDGGASENAYFVDGYAFVADYSNGLEILDISDPENPYEVGQFFDGGGAYGIAFQNNLAFVADDTDGLEILEITGLFSTEETSGFSVLSIFITFYTTIVLFKIAKKRKE
jgi:hypothetical protein